MVECEQEGIGHDLYKPMMENKNTEVLEPSTGSLFETIQCLMHLTDMVKALRIHKARAVELDESILYIYLPNLSYNLFVILREFWYFALYFIVGHVSLLYAKRDEKKEFWSKSN